MFPCVEIRDLPLRLSPRFFVVVVVDNKPNRKLLVAGVDGESSKCSYAIHNNAPTPWWWLWPLASDRQGTRKPRAKPARAVERSSEAQARAGLTAHSPRAECQQQCGFFSWVLWLGIAIVGDYFFLSNQTASFLIVPALHL